jgi:ACS family tartrate transporter-like MFS transporter
VSETAEEARVLRKVAWRLLPFMGLLYFACYLDRVNVGFAALTMNADVGLDAAAFGLGSGIFFIGYFLFEIPSNLILEKVGARLWIARIMVTWGLLSAAMALVRGPTSFYVVRFLLGLAEAGFFPGMILYLTYWFPWTQRAKITAGFMMAIPLSSALGAPISTLVLGTSIFGLHGWQTMFLLEGIPAVVLGVIVFFRMTGRPAKAGWLTESEKTALQRAIDRDAAPEGGAHLEGLSSALANPQVWRFALVYFGVIMGNYGLGFWLPQIVKGLGHLSNFQTGLLTAAPYVVAAGTMALWGRHADRTQERVWHFVIPSAIAAAAFLVAGLIDDPAVRFAGLAIATIGVSCAAPMLWSFPTRFLRASAAAGGIALINSVGNLAGYVGPSLMGFIKQATGVFGGGLIALAVSVAFAALLAIELPRRRAAPASP